MKTEFDLTPGHRTILYKKLFGLTTKAIRETRWYRMCGRKIIYRNEQDALQNLTADLSEGVAPYRCRYYPKNHYHLGHERTHVPKRYSTSDFERRVRAYFEQNNFVLEGLPCDHQDD